MSQPPERRLVRDLMQVGVPSCAPQIPVAELAQEFLEKGLEGVIVLDENGHGVGAVTRRELLHAFIHGETESLCAEDIMRDDVPQAPPDIPLTAAAQIMEDLQVHILFIMHHAGGISYPAAILTGSHILRLLAAANETELDDLGIRAQREPPLQAFFRRRDEARKQAGIRPSERPPDEVNERKT